MKFSTVYKIFVLSTVFFVATFYKNPARAEPIYCNTYTECVGIGECSAQALFATDCGAAGGYCESVGSHTCNVTENSWDSTDSWLHGFSRQ